MIEQLKVNNISFPTRFRPVLHSTSPALPSFANNYSTNRLLTPLIRSKMQSPPRLLPIAVVPRLSTLTMGDLSKIQIGTSTLGGCLLSFPWRYFLLCIRLWFWGLFLFRHFTIATTFTRAIRNYIQGNIFSYTELDYQVLDHFS